MKIISKNIIHLCIVAIVGVSSFCNCSSGELEEIQQLESKSNVMKKSDVPMYDYLYAKIENVDLYSHFNRTFKVYPFLGNLGAVTGFSQMPAIESIVEYKIPNPDYHHTTILLRVYDHWAMDIPVNTLDGDVTMARLDLPCSFAFVYYDKNNPTLEDIKAVDWYTATIKTYDTVGFFPPRQ